MNRSTAKGDGKLTSGTTKLMAISSRKKGEIEDSEELLKEIARVLEVLEQCRRQEDGFEAVE